MGPPGTVTTAKGEGGAHAWEDTSGQNVWEKAVQEDAEGNIVVAAGDTLAQAIRKRRKRLEQNDYSQRNRRVVRDMIRYVYILIDASRWTRQKDPVLPPGTRLDAILECLQRFVDEFYDQNPLSHLGFCLVKDGEAEILSALSSNSRTHKLALQSVATMAAAQGSAEGGEWSLQNGLNVAGRSLGHQPRHGSREVVVITAALSTCDPGDILSETLPKLQHAKIRVSCLALSAELHVCRKIAEATTGTMGVCLDKAHFRDWMQAQCVPPPALRDETMEANNSLGCEMLKMGFPTRKQSEVAELVHATREKTILARTAYECPQCKAKNAELPVDCAVCGLKLVLAPHLARSFHHLFPVAPFVERALLQKETAAAAASSSSSPVDGRKVVSSSSSVSKKKNKKKNDDINYLTALSNSLLVTSKDEDMCCFTCLRPFGSTAAEIRSPLDATPSSSTVGGSEELLRFQCPECENYFCVDCDAFLHDTLHNCPGCLRK